MKTITIDKFDGGIVPNKRHQSDNASVLSQRFDTARTKTLKPYRDFALDAVTEADLDGFGITKMVKVATVMYGFGHVSAAVQRAQVYKKTTTSETSAWTIVTNATSASGGARDDILFLYYKNQDTLYGANSGGIWSHTVAGDTFTYNENTSVAPTGQGIVHSKDDKIYIPCGAVIASKDAGGGWNNDAFTGLPSDFSSVSVAEYDNLLVVAGNRTKGGIVYFWDRDSTVATAIGLTEFGEQTIKWAENIGGIIVVCCTRVDATTGFNELVFYELVGDKAKEIVSYNAGSSGAVTLYSAPQKFGDSVQFLMDLTVDGSLLAGIFSFAKNADDTFRFEFITPPRNDTAVTGGKLKAFFRTNGYHFISYLNENDGQKYTVWRTGTSFTGTARWNTTIDPGAKEDRSKLKQLMVVALYYEPLPSAGQAVLYYRVDGGAWVTIFTETTDSAVATEMANIGTSEFTSGREYEFKIESTGNAVITKLAWKYELLETLI